MKPVDWVKNAAGFENLTYGLEFPLHEQQGYLTPNEQFFVCNAADTPLIDAAGWLLTLDGDALQQPLTLSYDDLLALPRKTVPAFIECAGNHRRLFRDVLGEQLNKRPHMTEVIWGLGGVGMAEWTGVSLRDVLLKAGVNRDAVHVCPMGADHTEDEGVIRCPMPLAKALDPDTLIAFEMNGVPLPPDHGFPARMIVPGWIGTYSIKWLKRINVTMAHQWVHRNTELYVLTGDAWAADNYLPAQGAPITKQSIKSSLALPWPAHLKAGRRTVHGYARSPDAPIRQVSWSADDGRTWAEAAIASPNVKYAWARFAFDWDATLGEHTLMTRAIDQNGQSQPDCVPFNNGGYLFNMVHPHPVIVL